MELLWQVELPRLAKEVQPLLGLFYNGVYVIVPLQFLRDGGASTSFSNDVMTTDVRATGFLSVSPVILYFFWMGMMVKRLKHEGTLCSSSDLLKIFVKMWASWSAQDFRQAGVTQSGPGTFFLFCLRKTWHTSSLLIWIAGVGREGLLEVLMVVWRGAQSGCGVFFKPAIELIQSASCLFSTVLGDGVLLLFISFRPFHADAKSLEDNWILNLSE